jgi:glycerophosphoryl diester phosphodiesterase
LTRFNVEVYNLIIDTEVLSEMNVRDTLVQLKERNKVIIAAHRGVSGGNVICNTIPAYETALRQHADIVEIDAAMSADGVFYAFHDGTEFITLGAARNIRYMASSRIDRLFYRNPCLEATDEHVNRLEDVFNYLRGRCLINIDRSWFYWKEIIDFIKKMKMEDQIILKSPPEPQYLEILQSMAPDMAYMPIVRSPSEADLVTKYRINYCMAELIFPEISSPTADPALINKLHAEGLLLWANVITLNDWIIMTGGKDDRNSVTGNPAENWGWCIDRGFDVLQTDWSMLLREYIDSRR